jgi:uncharacterized 2Fe-2S/4Fe-4S cluster protein (DUF4445 family)
VSVKKEGRMQTHTVIFLPHEKKIQVPAGTRLIRAAMEAGVHINASCGGDGVCGKCRVQIEAGGVTEGLSEKLSATDVAEGYRLACKAVVNEDVTVRIPVESSVDTSVLNMAATPRRTARIQQLDFDAFREEGLFLPPVEEIYIELPEPNAQDHLPDVTRLISHLKLAHGEGRITANLEVIRKIPDILRASDFKVTAIIARPVFETGKSEIINVQPGDTTDRNYAVAVDIGTTTVYGQLIDLITGKVVSEYGEFNPQISYGEDVITRIMVAEKGDGLEKLHKVVVGVINKIIAKLLKRGKVEREDVSSLTLAGNTTMTQLFLKVNPRYIRRSPYVPAATLYPPVPAKELGIELNDFATALVYPAVSSYVGGDIVAGVMGSQIYLSEELTLFMDIGTNAEIVIGNKDWFACAACSAGPALEGGGIKFGMRAARGAIEDFSIDPVTLEPMLITIGSQRPKGICGSGLIIMAAVMFELGIINNLGKFNRDLDTPRIRENEGIYEYVLAWADQTQIERDIALTEIDLENLIRAKGAIYSGCQTLLAEVGMSMDDLDRIILAGGFGSYIDLEKAMVIGLLPEIDPDKVAFIGNASLLGARMSALTNRIRRDVVKVTRNMTNFELSETPSYMDNYVAALFLPHTNIDQFPRLQRRLARRTTAADG